MDDPGNDNFRSPIRMHNASTTTYDYGCNTEIYGLIRIAMDDAGSYPWLMPRSHIHGLDAGLAMDVHSWQSLLVRSFPYCVRNHT